MCNRPCIYRPQGSRCADLTYASACNYAGIKGHTRTMTIAKMYKVKPRTPEHKELMKPANCPLFVQSELMRLIEDPYGKFVEKKPRKRTPKPYVPPADEKTLLELYAQGLSDWSMAVKLGTTEHRIAWWRKKRGLTRHRAARNSKK